MAAQIIPLRRRGLAVRIRGIKQTTVNGRTYLYHRASGKRIQARPHTPEFLAEVTALDAGAEVVAKRVVGRHPRYQGATWGALVEGYRQSSMYLELAPRSRHDYERVLKYLAVFANTPLVEFDAENCEKIRDTALADHKRRFASFVVQMLRLVLGWGRGRREFGTYENGAVGLAKFKGDGKANRPWTAAERAVVFAEATGMLRPALALGMYEGMRVQDVVSVPWSIYDGRGLRWIAEKTKRKGVEVFHPIAHEETRRVLDALPREAATIVSKNGRPVPYPTFNRILNQLIDRLETEGKVGKGLTFHGLRTTVATRLADEGADLRAIQAFLGHETLAMPEHYSRGADRKRAAITAAQLLAKAG